jgi:hypothetical protein
VRSFITVVGLALLSLSTAVSAAPLLLPAGEVVGGQEATLYVLALDDAGQPVRDLRLRGSASIGELTDWRPAGEGLYAVTYRGPVVQEATMVRVELRGKGSDREAISLIRDVQLSGVASAGTVMEANPTALVLGDDASATLSLSLPPGTQPSMMASFGNVDTLTPLGDGRWTARYLPRAVNFPHVAIIGMVDERGDGATVVGIPLSGKVQFPVAAPEGATVILRIGDREYGPVRSASDGAALVPIVVPPGVNIATQIVVIDGQVTESALDLAIPASRRIALLPLPTAVPEGSQVTVYAAVVEPTGELDAVTLPQITTSVGTMTAVRRVSPGVVAVDWTVDPSDATTASVTVSLTEEDNQTSTVEVGILDGRPASIELAHDEIVGSGPVAVEVIVRDADDRAAAGYSVSLLGNDEVSLTDGGRGTYRGVATLTPTSRDRLVAVATPATGLPTASLAFSVPRRTVAPNGALPIAVVALDRYGVPVPGVAVALEVVEGGGRLERTVATGDSGVAMARYRSPETESAVRIVARAGDIEADLVLAQVPASADIDLPPFSSSDGAVFWRATSAWLGGVPDAVVPVVESGMDEVEVPAEESPVVETGRPQSDPHRAARLRGSFVGSSYTYTQDPNGDGGPLLGNAVVVGTDLGDGAATPVGVEAVARIFNALPYVGLAGRYRSTWYSVTAPEFEGAVAKDSLQLAHIAVVGRYPIRLSRNALLSPGLRVGGEFSDFIYFTGDVEARQIEYTTLTIPALTIGGELALDTESVFAVVSYDGSLAYGTDPYSGRLDVEAGVNLTDALFVSVGGGYGARSVTITGNTSGNDLGELTDRQLHGQAGIGVSF